MKYKQRLMGLAMIVLLFILFYPNASFGYPTADSLQFTLDNYLQKKGENYFSRKDYVEIGKWHLGDDVDAKAGNNIYVIGNGIVRHAAYHAPKYDTNGKLITRNYGGMYIIEHNVNGEKICALYVHMNFATFTKSVGQEVTKGEYLGQVGTQQQNGDYPEHFHFGIRKGEYPVNPNEYKYGDWIFSGYTSNESILNDWYDPTNFINDHKITTPYVYSSHAYNGSGDVQGGESTGWNYSLPVKKTQFTVGETAKAMIRVENIKARHRWFVEIWREGTKVREYFWDWNDVGSGWNTSYFWPEQAVNSEGNWQFKAYLYIGDDSRRDHIVDLNFTVVKPAGWQPFTYDDNGYTGYGPQEGGENTSWNFSLPRKAVTFNEGDHVYGMIRVNNISINHKYKVKAYLNGVFDYGYEWGWNNVGGGCWNTSYFWPELNYARVGNWEFKVYLEHSDQTDLIDTLSFVVVRPAGWKPYTYGDDNGYTGYGPPEGGENTSWNFSLPRPSTTFNKGDHIYGMIHVNNISVNHKYKVKAYLNGTFDYEYEWGWNNVGGGCWNTSYFWPELNYARVGNWRFDILIDITENSQDDYQFIDALYFTAIGDSNPAIPPNPAIPTKPSIRFDFNNHDAQGWTVGYGTIYVSQNQPDKDTWMVVAQGQNPGIVSPELPSGFSTSQTPELRFSAKIRGKIRNTYGQIWIMDNNGYWGYEMRVDPVKVDYNYYEYIFQLSHFGNVPIKRFSIELTQDAPYEQWIFDWVELK